jgi:hypothetical protein
MVMAKKTDLGLIVSAALIAALLFAAGLAIGYDLNSQRLTEIEQKSQEMIKTLQDFQLQFLFLDVLSKNASCPVLDQIMAYTVKNYEQIGAKLANKELEDYTQYENLLRDYYVASINYWLLAKKLEQSCGQKYKTILFFISKSCDQYIPNPCDDQAFVLTYLKQQMGEELLIFTINSDIQEPAIQALVNYYNITEYPSIVVDEKIYTGFQNLETLTKLLK